MILIISSKDDRTTNEVIDWIRRFNKKFVRISSNDDISITHVTIGEGNLRNIEFKLKGNTYNLNEFSIIWYRRNWFKIHSSYIFEHENLTFQNEVNKQLQSEIATLSNFFLYGLELNSLNRPSDIFLNKLKVLEYCNEFGLVTPSTIITTEKLNLLNFIEVSGKVITKNYSQGVFVNFNNNNLNSYTMLVTNEMISGLEDSFFPMMFQEYIEKVFELRVFFINENYYACAIISQNDNQTKIDFRNYNYINPNRTPPYELPLSLKKSLNKLMKKIGLNSGSIDLLVNVNGDYVFLEVNPIGQFAQVSKPCNYFIEKEVASYLSLNC